MHKEAVHELRQAVPRAIAKARHAAAPVVRHGRKFARRHPELIAGATAGYSFGVLIERIPGVRAFLGPLPRLTGLAVGAGFGLVFRQALREVQAEEGSDARTSECSGSPP